MKYDVAIVGAGLAGLVAACELIDGKKRVLLVDQEPENSMGGTGILVFWWHLFSKFTRAKEAWH